MMDDSEDGSSSGISGWAGYCLGVMAADSEREQNEYFAEMRARRHPQPKVYDAEKVHSVIDGWRKAVAFHEDRIEKIKADRAAVRLERDELREHNRVYGEESLAQLSYIRELSQKLTDLQKECEAAWQRERQAKVREDLLRFDLAELRSEIAKLKSQAE